MPRGTALTVQGHRHLQRKVKCRIRGCRPQRPYPPQGHRPPLPTRLRMQAGSEAAAGEEISWIPGSFNLTFPSFELGPCTGTGSCILPSLLRTTWIGDCTERDGVSRRRFTCVHARLSPLIMARAGGEGMPRRHPPRGRGRPPRGPSVLPPPRVSRLLADVARAGERGRFWRKLPSACGFPLAVRGNFETFIHLMSPTCPSMERHRKFTSDHTQLSSLVHASLTVRLSADPCVGPCGVQGDLPRYERVRRLLKAHACPQVVDAGPPYTLAA